jgi:ABC-2 type transport system ATP-binding protein
MTQIPKPPETNTDRKVDDSKPMIVIDHVDMVFNIASEQLNSLKEYFIKLVRHELFFRAFNALEDISITVNRGDVYGIVGTNGSGKSTLLKIIAGVLKPTQGSCQVNGSIAPLIELGAGFDPELTARENVYLNGALLGYSKEFIDANFQNIIDFADINDFVDMPLKNYSSGMTARIAFAIATATVPDILVVDEALSVGDFLFQEKCERRINSLVGEHGTTLLFVSHSIDQVERLCKKALWIEKGKMQMQGDVKAVCEAYRHLEQ